MPRSTPEMTARARAMRKQPTPAERALWRILADPAFAAWRFRRQHPVPPYILDIACVRAPVAIEADGGQHAESRHDEARDEYLANRGWRLLRFWNNEILDNSEGVAVAILAALRKDPPS